MPDIFRKNPVAISYTGWKRYHECAQRHYLIMTGQRPTHRDERNFFRGIVLHQVLEDWLNNDEPPSWMGTVVEETWHRLLALQTDEGKPEHVVLWKNATDQQTMLDQALKWGVSLATIIEGMNLDRSTCEAEKEVVRQFDLGGTWVKMKGKIDLTVPSQSGGPVLFDLKASVNKQMMDPYQLVFYSLLMDGYLPEGQMIEHGGFIMPAFDRVFPYQVTQESREWLSASICQMVRDIVDDKFDPDPSDSKCFMCDVKAVCPVKGGMMPQGTGRQMI